MIATNQKQKPLKIYDICERYGFNRNQVIFRAALRARTTEEAEQKAVKLLGLSENRYHLAKSQKVGVPINGWFVRLNVETEQLEKLQAELDVLSAQKKAIELKMADIYREIRLIR